jgi:exopolyphosphatase/guanosine-5'-triphosphate,3'-diphosphate pyrophosphatase
VRSPVSDRPSSIPILGLEGRVVGFMDIGTNSARLVIVRLQPNDVVTVLSEQKEVIRLGDGEFVDGYLQPLAMDRAALVCRTLADMARTYGAEEIVAIATSATREAKNQAEFVRRLRQEAGLNVRVISGLEEARLTYLGVASGFNLGDKQVLFLDIGGGSTELVLGNEQEPVVLESLKLGAIRLTNLFFLPTESGPVTPARYALIKRFVRSTAVRSVQHLQSQSIDLTIGISGTIENLADVAAQALHGRRRQREEPLAYEDLRRTAELLCAVPLEERRRVPGINPGRADIIIAGAAILDTLMEDLGITQVLVNDRGLREGLLADYRARHQPSQADRPLSVRDRSVLQLGRACRFDEAHGRQVAGLALQLFDSAQAAGLHALGRWERELLEHAAMLHDVGTFLSYSNHEAHTHYVICNAEMLGFDQTEIQLVAAVARFHRKGLPGPKYPEYLALDKRSRRTVRQLSFLLRLAESLDRSHGGIVARTRLRAAAGGGVVLEIQADRDCPLEQWGTEGHRAAFKKVFGRPLTVVVAAAQPSLFGAADTGSG